MKASETALQKIEKASNPSDAGRSLYARYDYHYGGYGEWNRLSTEARAAWCDLAAELSPAAGEAPARAESSE